MINAILIDDEEPALLEMEFWLKNYPYINILGKYTNPVTALEKVRQLNPHVVFLDINMPQLGGMSVAKMLFENKIETDIVFVTAYEQHAVEAFNVQALDYLLKPVSRKRLDQTIARITHRRSMESPEEHKKLEIRSMGCLQVGWAGETPLKWRTEKEKELFAFLLQNRGLEVYKDRIIDCLWNDCEMDKATRQLHNSIYYVRKTLEEYGISREQIHIGRGYCLKLGDVFYDREIIHRQMGNPGNPLTVGELEKQLELFRGGYLEFEDWAWADIDREMLAKYEIDLLLQLSEKYLEAEVYNKAEFALRTAFNKDPLKEKITQRLLEFYKKTGENIKAMKHFQKYQKILREELKVIPRSSIKKQESNRKR